MWHNTHGECGSWYVVGSVIPILNGCGIFIFVNVLVDIRVSITVLKVMKEERLYIRCAPTKIEG